MQANIELFKHCLDFHTHFDHLATSTSASPNDLKFLEDHKEHSTFAIMLQCLKSQFGPILDHPTAASRVCHLNTAAATAAAWVRYGWKEHMVLCCRAEAAVLRVALDAEA